MPRSKDFVRAFVNIMSFCYFCGNLLCRILMCGHISYTVRGNKPRVCVYAGVWLLA
jgi:hypothetical protein